MTKSLGEDYIESGFNCEQLQDILVEGSTLLHEMSAEQLELFKKTVDAYMGRCAVPGRKYTNLYKPLLED